MEYTNAVTIVSVYVHEINSASFRVTDVFDDIDDMEWFPSYLVKNIMDENDSRKFKNVKQNRCLMRN